MNGFISYFWIIHLIEMSISEKVILLNTSTHGWTNWMKNTKKFEGWRIQNLPPHGDEVYGVCNVHQVSSNSWLRSPFIPREKGKNLQIKISFTMRECKNYPDQNSLKHCEETFTLLKFESGQPTNNIQYNRRFFDVVDTISPNRKWENKDRTENILNIHESSISVSRAGVIIAFQNTGSCVMIKEVTVFYLNCLDKIINFLHFPQTVADLENKSKKVEGKCVAGGTKIFSHSNEHIWNYCQPDGKWKLKDVKQVCECEPGMEGNINNTKCLKCARNYFKPLSGSQLCVPCPKNSDSSAGSSTCYCNSGFYQIPNNNHELICKRPPDKPRNIQFEVSDQARIILSWDPPTNFGYSESASDNNTLYSVICINCPNKLSYEPSSEVSGNRVIILGSLPSREYSFKVVTINEVSQYVTSEFDNEQSSAKITLLTNPIAVKMEKIEMISMRIFKQGIIVSWDIPKTTQNIMEYECVLMGYLMNVGNDSVNPNFISHIFENNTSHKFSDLRSDLIHFTSKVRPRYSIGWGEFSESVSITREKIIPRNDKISKSQNITTRAPIIVWTDNEIFHVTPKKDLMMMIFGSVLLVAVLLIIIALVTYFIRRQMTFNMYRQKFHNEKFEQTTPTHIIYSSAYSLPNQSLSKYQNPNTYEDISIALHDFTKEIDPNWLTTKSIIGQGEFGNIYDGVLSVPGEEKKIVAIKALMAGATEKEKNDFLVEATTMGQFCNENIIRLEGVVTASDPHMIIIEYMNHEPLLPYLRNKKSELSIFQLLKILSNVANGMKYLSSIGFVHKDLAARNILLDENLVAKIADFGLSKEISCENMEEIYSNKADGKISIKWTAPETILYGKFSHSTDVWSFGVLSWEVLSYGETPYWQWTNHEVIDAIQSGYRLPPPENCPPIMHNLLLHCWNLNPDKRPTFPHLHYEIEQISSQLNVNINNSEFKRKDIKMCETAHLLRHTNDVSKDLIYDISAPQPPPRNIFVDIKGSKIAAAPEVNALHSIYPRKSFGCLNIQGSNDLTNYPTKFENGSQTVTLTRMNHPSFFHQPYRYFQNKTFHQPCNMQKNYDSLSYAPDYSKFPEIPPHKSSIIRNKMSRISIEDFLRNLHLPQLIPNFLKNGIYYVDQITNIKTEKLKVMGVNSIHDQKTIIRALQPPMYC